MCFGLLDRLIVFTNAADDESRVLVDFFYGRNVVLGKLRLTGTELTMISTAREKLLMKVHFNLQKM